MALVRAREEIRRLWQAVERVGEAIDGERGIDVLPASLAVEELRDARRSAELALRDTQELADCAVDDVATELPGAVRPITGVVLRTERQSQICLTEPAAVIDRAAATISLRERTFRLSRAGSDAWAIDDAVDGRRFGWFAVERADGALWRVANWHTDPTARRSEAPGVDALTVAKAWIVGCDSIGSSPEPASEALIDDA
jgi:hypothetical protein